MGTGGTKISFKSLTKSDKKEFVDTTKEILEIKDELIELLFKEFIGADERFKEMLKRLLSRKANFLKAFSPEVSFLLQQEMENINNEAAMKIYENWNSSTYVVGMRREVIE